jgi:hypothetical protein
VKSSGLPYHRRITIRPAPDTGDIAGSADVLEAQMQDHCHHVRVEVTHAGGRIESAAAQGIRLPWNTCPLAIAGVGRLAGMSVEDALDIRNWPGGRTANCVHMSDLALVALAHVQDTEAFVYAITVTPAMGPVRTARLERNDELVLEWTVKGDTLTSPAEWAGRTLGRADFQAWTADLDPRLREAAAVLRRACHIAPSRDIDLDTMAVASESITPSPSCYTLQPGVIEIARRVVGSSRAELTDADGPPPS